MNPDSCRILLPVDGSADALAAVRHALQRCGGAPGASFVLVNVQGPPSLYEVMVAHDAERIQALRRDAGTDLLSGADVVIPVPLHPLRALQRGFNQADDLAREIGLPVWRVLRRVRHGPPQASLPAARRNANVRAAQRALVPLPAV